MFVDRRDVRGCCQHTSLYTDGNLVTEYDITSNNASGGTTVCKANRDHMYTIFQNPSGKERKTTEQHAG